MVSQARTGRNQATDDDVLFQATQLVALAHDGGLGEHAGGFLEGGGRDEAVGGQRRLGNAQQDVGVGRGDLAFALDGLVGVEDLRALDLLALDVGGLARVLHHHAAQHLAHDHFNVLVVDLHTLQAVHVLHFIDDVAGQLFDAQQAQDVLRIGRAVHNVLALVHHLAFVDQHVFLFGDQLFPDVAIGVGDLQAHFAFGLLTERHRTGLLRQRAFVFGRTRLEQLGHAGQTAGNVAGFLPFDRDAGQHFAGAHFLAVAHLDQRPHLEANGHRQLGAGDFHFLAIGIDQAHQRAHHLGRTTAFGVDHHQGRKTGHIVHLLGHREAFFDVLELGRTSVLGDDGAGQRVPVRQDGTGLDAFIGLDVQHRAIGHLVALALAAVVGNDDFARARNHHQLALVVGHIAHGGVEANRAVGLGFHAGGHRRTRGRTPNVEGAHGQLGAGLADRLGGNHAHGLAQVHQAATAQVTAIALGAQPVTGFAGQCRANLDFINADCFQFIECELVEQGARRQQQAVGFRVQQVFGGGAAQHAVAQGFDHLAALDDGTHHGALGGAAIVFGHDQVLRHVHQTAR